MDVRRFIIWDPRDGHHRPDSNGIIGRVGIDNAYLRAYAAWIDGKTAEDLKVGESTLAKFSLSGTHGTYLVVRVDDAPLRCDFRYEHDAATDQPMGGRCDADATHRIAWEDGRFSLGCDAHLEIDPAATVKPVEIRKIEAANGGS